MKGSWKEKLITLSTFIVAVLISIKLRILNPWHFVFKDWGVIFTGNDPWYYYRLIDSCVHNFPKRLWFDAFTYYPYGTYVHFGPFLVYLGAIIVKLLGATNPISMRTVLSFIPVIGGILLVFAVYLLSREAFDKKTALIAALVVSVLPGQILYRGSLGFNDHHIWEVFWMTTSLGTFLYSYNKLKNKNIKDIIKSKKILYVVPSGLALGFYLLAWAPGFINALIISTFVFLVFVFGKYLNADFENLVFTGISTFLIAALIYLPFAFKYPGFSTAYYSPFQLLILLSMAGFLSLLFLFNYADKKGYLSKFGNSYYISVSLAIGIVIIGTLSLGIIFPSFLRLLKSIIGVIHPKGGQLTIAEVQPFFSRGLSEVYGNFGTTFYFTVIGYLLISYYIWKRRDEKALLVLWWGILMLIALAGQSRFAYYYGAVCAIFSAFVVEQIFKYLKFYDEFIQVLKNKLKVNKKTIAKVVFGIVLFGYLLYPTYVLADLQSKYAGGGIPKQWYDALIWMRSNTPDPGLNYYEIYKPPPKLGEKYPYYPNTTYGVMSWWDYGHWITAIARRIPNANPFQQGIGNKYNNVPGAAPFFTAFNESYADKIADKLGVKYVISDIEMATGKFYAMATWAEGSLEKATMYYTWPVKIGNNVMYTAKTVYVYVTPNGSIGVSEYLATIPENARILGRVQVPGPLYFRTMEAKLHILDTLGLKHYRLIYESDPAKGWMALQEIIYKMIYNKYFANNSIPINITPSGYVKIFEYVPGAKIIGKVNSTNTTYAELFLKVRTNKGRVFTYYQRVNIINGTFEFVVPYAQNTKYPVKPITPYMIMVGNHIKEISISDADVEKGKLVYLGTV